MANYAITKEFSRAWRYRCGTRSTATERKKMKRGANRRLRRVFKKTGRTIKPTTGWDVV